MIARITQRVLASPFIKLVLSMECIEDADWLNNDEDSLEELNESDFLSLSICSSNAKMNYELAGKEVPDEEDQISMADNEHLLNDQVHLHIQELLHELQLPFPLSSYQLLSLHVLGSSRNLMLVSPTGSGKTMVIYLGTLLLRKMLDLPEGVAIITEPLNMILAEKLKSKVVPTGVISMTGELKSSLEERDGVKLSAPEENFLDGSLPCLFGHPESWLSEKGRQLVKELHKRNRILLIATDEMTCSLNWANIRCVLFSLKVETFI